MSPEFFIAHALGPALSLLPAAMDSQAARAMLVCVALQESRLKHRRQIGGPARGYLQFELGGGVRGVLTHKATVLHIRSVLVALDYDPASSAADCYNAIEHCDILAAAFARLLLWTAPAALPTRSEANKGYGQYLDTWRPGKAKPGTWDAFFKQAWKAVS